MPAASPHAPGLLPRILVVDDSPDSLWLMSQLLEGRYEVLQAASGQEALATVAQDPVPDLLLLDIVMPDMDGYEVLRRLRQQPRTAGIPVAFMTSLTEREQQVLGRELGAIDYLTKPVDVREVIQRVEAHVQGRQQARRMEVLGERLARHLSPGEWQDLFHGETAGSLEFVQLPLCLLWVTAAPLNGSAGERAEFQAQLAQLAARHGGGLDAFERDATVLLFDEPAAALQAALELQQGCPRHGVRLALHDVRADLARFEHRMAPQRTLVGGEMERLVREYGPPGAGLGISPSAYAALRAELGGPLPGPVVFTARWEGEAVVQGQIVPLHPAQPDATRRPG